jgi:hypothetical protein
MSHSLTKAQRQSVIVFVLALFVLLALIVLYLFL